MSVPTSPVLTSECEQRDLDDLKRMECIESDETRKFEKKSKSMDRIRIVKTKGRKEKVEDFETFFQSSLRLKYSLTSSTVLFL